MPAIPGYDQHDIEWILEADIKVRKIGSGYLIIERVAHVHDGDGTVEGCPGCFPRECAITIREVGNSGYARMLFNGNDIETEAYMSYVGLLDQVDNEGPNGEWVEFDMENL